MNQRARSKSWMPMSTRMPAAARRVRVLEARPERIARRRLEHDRLPDAPSCDLPLGRRVAGIEPAHESHLKERAAALRRRPAISDASVERQRRRLLAERRLLRAAAAATTTSRCVCVGLTMTMASTSGSAISSAGSPYQRGTSNSAAISSRERGVGIGHRRQPCLRDARRRVARVDAAQPTESDQPDHCSFFFDDALIP